MTVCSMCQKSYVGGLPRISGLFRIIGAFFRFFGLAGNASLCPNVLFGSQVISYGLGKKRAYVAPRGLYGDIVRVLSIAATDSCGRGDLDDLVPVGGARGELDQLVPVEAVSAMSSTSWRPSAVRAAASIRWSRSAVAAAISTTWSR
jgi:hypothetical protein